MSKLKTSEIEDAFKKRCFMGTTFSDPNLEWPWKWFWPHKRAAIKTNVRTYQFLRIFLETKK